MFRAAAVDISSERVFVLLMGKFLKGPITDVMAVCTSVVACVRMRVCVRVCVRVNACFCVYACYCTFVI